MGIPTLLVLSVWGLTKLLFGGIAIAGAPMVSALTGFVLVWSTPAVFRIEGLSK